MGNISQSVIRRLPRYYRFLGDLESSGITRISSAELSKRMGITASQIRQDLNCFGGFGQQGYGYNIEMLKSEIGKILYLDKTENAIVVGAGNLGKAIATNMTFDTKGFKLVGIFDKKESVVGQVIKGMPIMNFDDIDDFCKEYTPSLAVLCIPKESAEEVVFKLVKLGVKGFLNFSHYDINLAFDNVCVENVHCADNLMILSYGINNLKK